jgi:hypothetical protein
MTTHLQRRARPSADPDGVRWRPVGDGAVESAWSYHEVSERHVLEVRLACAPQLSLARVLPGGRREGIALEAEAERLAGELLRRVRVGALLPGDGGG